MHDRHFNCTVSKTKLKLWSSEHALSETRWKIAWNHLELSSQTLHCNWCLMPPGNQWWCQNLILQSLDPRMSNWYCLLSRIGSRPMRRGREILPEMWALTLGRCRRSGVGASPYLDLWVSYHCTRWWPSDVAAAGQVFSWTRIALETSVVECS